MATIHKQPFTSSGEFSVRKAFTFDGEDYKPDNDFPYEELGCTSRKLKNLYEAGYIKHKVNEEDDDTEETDSGNDTKESRRARKLEQKAARKAARKAA